MRNTRSKAKNAKERWWSRGDYERIIARLDAGYTRAELCEEFGRSPAAISVIAHKLRAGGRIKSPRIGTPASEVKMLSPDEVKYLREHE